MPEIAPSSTGLSGEYFVAAELYRRGFLVALTIGNAKAIDILAQKDNKTFSIQVKSNLQTKECGLAYHEREGIKNCLLCFCKLKW